MPLMKVWSGEDWIIFDANDAKTLGGKKPEDFVPSSHIGAGGDAHRPAVPNGEAGFLTGPDKAKLDALSPDAERNQDAFSQVKVGSTYIVADTPTDTLELVAGKNITITPNETLDSITLSVDIDGIETTSPGGTESNVVAMTNNQGRVGDSERIGGKTLYELDLRYATAGSGGGTISEGYGEAIFSYSPETTRVNPASNRVQIPYPNFDIQTNVLLVFQNSTFLQHGKDYTIDSITGDIVKTSGVWGADTIIDFVMMKIVTSGDMLKIHQYESFTKATVDGQIQFNINIPEFEPGVDGLDVYQDGLRLSLNNHFQLNTDGTMIQLIGYAADIGTEFQFVVLKKMKVKEGN